MHLSERRLRTLIRALLEEVTPSSFGVNPMDAPIEQTSIEKAAKEKEQGMKSDFDDELADLLAKKMKEKGSSEASVNDMRKAVRDGR